MSVISWTDRREEITNQIRAADITAGREMREWLKYLSGDAAVFVEIVQIEGPVEFISDGASQDDGQTYNKVLQQEKEK